MQQKVSAPVNGALELLHIFSPNLVNEAKFGFNRATSNTYNLNKTGILYQIAISTGPGPGFITQNYNYDSIYAGNSFSWHRQPDLDSRPAYLQSSEWSSVAFN